MNKKVLSLIFVIGLMFVISGCANNNSGSTTNQSIDQKQEQAKAPEKILQWSDLQDKTFVGSYKMKDNIDKESNSYVNIVLNLELKFNNDKKAVLHGYFATKQYDNGELIDEDDAYVDNTVDYELVKIDGNKVSIHYYSNDVDESDMDFEYKDGQLLLSKDMIKKYVALYYPNFGEVDFLDGEALVLK